METYLDLQNNTDYEKLKKPSKVIKEGGIVVFPTETVYGIGVNGLDKNAIKRLYEVKKRLQNKPISLLVSNMEMINKVAKNITTLENELIKEFFPGPLTIILKKRDIVPSILTANTDTIGVRMPDEEIALKLIEYANTPIATSSANISGETYKTDVDQIKKDFEGKIDFFIDGGKSKIGIASTVVKVINEVPYILRQGSITKEQIEKVWRNTIRK